MPTSGRPTSRAILTIPSLHLSWTVDAVLLNLEVDVVGPDGLHQLTRVDTSIVDPVVAEQPAEARGQAARERDHALAVLCQLGHVDAGLAALVALQEAARGQLDQVAVAGLVGGEQREVVALHPPRRAVGVIVDDVDLAAEDRLDVVLTARLEELDRAVHHTVVGEAERRLPELGGARGELLDLARPVEQRVLGVDVEVGAGRGHRQLSRRSDADAHAVLCARRA